MDVLFISPNNASKTYQGLANKFSAVEPPTWALLLAESCRSAGHAVGILDCLAENLSDEEAFDRIVEKNPKLICFVVYGQNVNAGTTNMGGATRFSNFIKQNTRDNTLIGFIGSHVQALPVETLENEPSIDFVFLNEGVYALREILKTKSFKVEDILAIQGLAVRHDEKVVITGSPSVVPQENLNEVMPGYAWDLLPMHEKAMDLYRSPLWHANYVEDNRSPYAAIQTSIGCRFKCSFCMINLINKNDDKPVSCASDYNGMRHWSLEFVTNEFNKLISMGVKTIRITDEMFFLNRRYYRPIIDALIQMNEHDDLFIWAYSRIDTVPDPETLVKIRKAGFRWLCLGIESGDKDIRLEVSKGKFEFVDVYRVVQQIEDAGINVMANYIYGLPGDNMDSIQRTYDLSVDLNTLGWNTYAAMALPGSPLYIEARQKGIRVPKSYEEFSFHSYETLPLPTVHLDAATILKLRDDKFHEYFSRDQFIRRVRSEFGDSAVKSINRMLEVRLKRKIIEEANS